jgi:predicted nucleic acid-binding protein
VFLDTNVLLYAFVSTDPRQGRALELLLTGGVVSVQVLNEFVSAARSKLKMDAAELDRSLEVVRSLCPSVLDSTVADHEASFDLSRNGGLHIYDATIIASAVRAGCETLWTEDMQDGRVIDGLTIRNPF